MHMALIGTAADVYGPLIVGALATAVVGGPIAGLGCDQTTTQVRPRVPGGFYRDSMLSFGQLGSLGMPTLAFTGRLRERTTRRGG
jgi:hypothetical protein